MPKIKNFKESRETSLGRKMLEFELHYSTTHGFFGKVPKEHWGMIQYLSDDQKKEYSLSFEYISKYQSESGYKSVMVKGDSEADSQDKTIKLILHILGQQTQRREVILVFFKGGVTTDRFGRGNDITNKEHPEIQVEYSIKYCTEISINGAEPRYYDIRIDTWRGGDEETKTEHRLNHKKVVILDDTPENRLMLETTYARLKELSLKLNEVLTDRDQILTIAASGQLLLK